MNDAIIHIVYIVKRIPMLDGAEAELALLFLGVVINILMTSDMYARVCVGWNII